MGERASLDGTPERGRERPTTCRGVARRRVSLRLMRNGSVRRSRYRYPRRIATEVDGWATRAHADSNAASTGDPMGDKSPKAKEKSKKQDTADKNQKKAVATAKATPSSASTAKKK